MYFDKIYLLAKQGLNNSLSQQSPSSSRLECGGTHAERLKSNLRQPLHQGPPLSIADCPLVDISMNQAAPQRSSFNKETN